MHNALDNSACISKICPRRLKVCYNNIFCERLKEEIYKKKHEYKGTQTHYEKYKTNEEETRKPHRGENLQRGPHM